MLNQFVLTYEFSEMESRKTCNMLNSQINALIQHRKKFIFKKSFTSLPPTNILRNAWVPFYI